MGLSSSQARLLSLTGRMHDIEYKAQKLEAQKLQMANESTQVYKEYENALNQTKIQFKQMAADGSIDYVDATYNILIGNNYKLSASGKLVVSQADINDFNSASIGGSDPMQFACIKSGFCKVNDADKVVLTSDESKVCIFTTNQLKAEASSTATKVLMADIDVSESMGVLKGTLDGNGHTITSSYNGYIFSTASGNIKNLNIHFNNAGNGFAEKTSGTTNIENVNISGSIKQTGTIEKVSALLGNVQNTTTIKNISSDINIQANKSTYVGSLIGLVSNSSLYKVNIENSSCEGSITSLTDNGYTGGFIGTIWSNDNSTNGLTIDGCYSNMDLNVDGSSAGSIIGRNDGDATITNSYSTGSIDLYNPKSGGASAAGGIVGHIYQSSGNETIIENCYTELNNITSETAGNNNESKGSIVGAFNQGSPGTLSVNNVGSNSTLKEIGTGNSAGSGGGTVVWDNNPNDNNTIKESVIASTENVGANVSKTYDPTTSPNFQHYYEIGKAIQSGEYLLVDGYEDDSNWLTNMINNAFIILAKLNPSTGSYDEVNVATDTSLQEVTDEVDLKKAEAKYEADMRKINQKDKKFDTELAAMEAERNAIKTEIETLKSVAKDNVDRTYKLFG